MKANDKTKQAFENWLWYNATHFTCYVQSNMKSNDKTNKQLQTNCDTM